jgi:hypothetical protein
MRFIVILIIFFVFLINFSTSQKQIIHKSSDIIPKDLEIIYFDNGIGSYWYEPNRPSKKIVFCFQEFKEFSKNMLNLRKLEELFVNYHIVYIEYSGFGISNSTYPTTSFSVLVIQLFEIYLCILRYKKWETIIFVGYDIGSILQAKLFELCLEKKYKIPDHIVQINGFCSINSLQLYKIPWFLQFLSTNEKIDISKIYKNKLKNPLLIFHSKNNMNAPFIDSISLFVKLKDESKFISLYGHQDKTLLSKENIEIMKENIEKYIDFINVDITYY